MIYGSCILTCSAPGCTKHEIVGTQQITNPMNPQQMAVQFVYMPRRNKELKKMELAKEADFWEIIDYTTGKVFCPKHKTQQTQQPKPQVVHKPEAPAAQS